MPAEKPNFFNDLKNFFCSLKLSVITLLLLAVASVVGTLLPQNLPAEQYQQQFGEAGFKLFQALQLYDVYHSWWFLGLLGIFALNLTACSLRRLPGVWRIVTRPTLFAEDALLNSLPYSKTFQTSLSPQEARAGLEKVASRHFGRLRATEKNGAVTLFAQRRAFARFSVYATHLSILLILLGAVIGSFWGFDSFVTLVEGESVDQVPGSQGKEPIPLGFNLRCDAFSVTFYDEKQTRPKEYRSLLTVLEDGREVPGFSKVPVLVNHPLQYGGLNFYQNSWGKTAQFRFGVTAVETGEETTVVAYPGQVMSLPNGDVFHIIDFYPAYRDQGPAAILAIKNAGGQVYGAVAPETGIGPVMVDSAPYRFRLVDMRELHYTGLQVKRDPGVPVVWAGCLMLVIGSLSAFFLSHQRLWLVLRPTAKGTKVRVGAGAHRNQSALARKFDRLCRDMEAKLNEGVVQEEKG